MIVKILRAGRIKLNFQMKRELTPLLEGIFNHFEADKFFANEKTYRVKLAKFSKKSFLRHRNAKKAKMILVDYLCGFYGESIRSPREIKKFKPFLWPLASKMFCDFVLKNQFRLKSNFLIRVIKKSFVFAIDLKNREGLIFHHPGKKKPFLQPGLGFIIHCLIKHLLSETLSFTIHSSSVKLDGEGYLFIGSGGAGKSTIARIILENVRDAKLISDDQAVITSNRTATIFYASRFRKDKKGFAAQISENQVLGRMKISRIYFIKKAVNARIEEYDKFEAFKEIMSEHITSSPWLSRKSAEIAINVLKLLNRCTVRRLYFAKNSGFIRFLRK
jgi:hypothetical protein